MTCEESHIMLLDIRQGNLQDLPYPPPSVLILFEHVYIYIYIKYSRHIFMYKCTCICTICINMHNDDEVCGSGFPWEKSV